MENFSHFKLSAPIARAIKELGFTAPTPIQVQTVPVLLEKETDFLGMAATGTGKTAAYGIPLLTKVTGEKSVTEAIILCPTRELALQITNSLKEIGKYLDATILPIYGGSAYDEQIRGLRSGANIVVATPGRLIDHLERGTLKLSNVETVILDEADEMISMGFTEDLERFFKAIKAAAGKKKVKTWLFSATMQPELRRIADRYLVDPVVVRVNQSQMLSGTVEQIYYTVREDEKPEVVCRILDSSEDFHGLIFCQTKSLVDDLDQYLRERGYASDQLHGDRSQAERERTLQRFKTKQIKVLVCTDVAARGLDIKDLSHVVNFSIPRELDSYVHRIGRTGRSGKAGVAISLVTQSHFGLVRRIEHLTRSKLTRGAIPSEKDVAANKVRKIMHQFLKLEPSKELNQLIEDGWSKEIASMTPAKIISRFLAILHPDLSGTKPRRLGVEVSERNDRYDGRRSSGPRGRYGRQGGGQGGRSGGRSRGREDHYRGRSERSSGQGRRARHD